MTYTLTVSREQQKHIRLCNALKCFEAHYRTTQTDSGGKRVPFFDDCTNCEDVRLCRPIRQVVDLINNGGC